MSNTTISTAIAYVSNVLDSPDYSDKEVFILIPNIRLADEAATKKYIEDFDKICVCSAENEPGTLKFCAFQPRSSPDGGQHIWALEQFDSESSLADHRASTPVKEMLSWLQTTRPNGAHPLPLPIPMQIIQGSFVRPAVKEVQDPFIVITEIKSHPDGLPSIEAGIIQFGVDTQGDEDTLMFMPGKTEKSIWVIAAYRSEQRFEEIGFMKRTMGYGNEGCVIESWTEHFLKLTVGYLFRS